MTETDHTHSPEQASISRTADRNGLNMSNLDSQLIDLLPIAAFVCAAPSGKLVHYNSRAAALWPNPEQHCDEFIEAIQSFGVSESGQNPLKQALERGTRFHDHSVLLKQVNGGKILARANIAPMALASYNPMGVLVLLEEQEAEKNLSVSSTPDPLVTELTSEYSRLLEIFDRSPVFMAVLRGPEHIFERANERYRCLIGNRAFIGKPVREALPEITHQGYIEILDRVYQSGEPFIGTNLPVALSPAPGQPLQELTLEFVYEPLPAEQGLEAGVLAVGIDLTERKRAEAELAFLTAESARASRLYETILGATPDLVYVFDLNHRFVFANRALLEMWGLTWQESIGKTCWELGYPDWHAALHDREIDQVVTTKEPLRGQVPFTGTKGERIYEYIFVPVLGEHGQVEAVAGTTRDITEHQHMEDELQHRAQELANADQKKDDFIAMLAHELRNPLAPLRNGLQLLQRGSLQESTQAEIHAMMDRQLRHMVRLIDDLLDVSRLSRNKLSLQKAPVSVARVITEALETLRPTIEAAGHRLEVSLPDESITVQADLTRLAQVIGNLLSNSSKYTGPNGDIVLTAKRCGPDIEISVKDNGIGIPPEALPNLFTMFTQAHHDLEQTTGGLGIGLALVKSLVEMHGGSVSAVSDGLHQGSTFSVRLPIIETGMGTTDKNQPAEPNPASSGGKRILVVDDNRDACDSMAMLFQMLGNQVEQAYDGLAAVSAVQKFRPNLILMDVGMPQLNGYEATRRIRSQTEGEKVTIIAVTGWGQEKDRSKSKAAGFDGHLVKPVALADLEQLLNILEPT